MADAIFLTLDDKYAGYAKECLLSIDKNYPDHPEILVFYDGTDPEVRSMLSSHAGVTLMPFDFGFLDLGNIGLGVNNSPKVYFRYILWTEAFARYDTIVHLDVDTLVLKPFPELFREENFFAVFDYTPFGQTLFKSDHYRDRQLLALLAADGLTGPPERFRMMNAGVFAIPKKYRTRAQFEKLVALTRRYGRFTRFADQAAVSLWCHLNDAPFSTKVEYNFQPSHLCSQELLGSPEVLGNLPADQIRILHYTWWKPDSIFYRKFMEYARFMADVDRTYARETPVPLAGPAGS